MDLLTVLRCIFNLLLKKYPFRSKQTSEAKILICELEIKLRVASWFLRVASCFSRVASRFLRVANLKKNLRVANLKKKFFTSCHMFCTSWKFKMLMFTSCEAAFDKLNIYELWCQCYQLPSHGWIKFQENKSL